MVQIMAEAEVSAITRVDMMSEKSGVVKGLVALGGFLGISFLYLVRRKQHLLGYDAAWKFRKSKSLKNVVLLVRHGQSEANIAQIISSDPKIGTKQHTITKRGESQAKRAGARIEAICQERGIAKADIPKNVVIYCSDFLRTRATAKAIAEELSINLADITPKVEIRERYFGELDGGSDERYNDVWEYDHYSVHHNAFGAESVASVLNRAGSLILDLDREHQNKVIVIVAHGDVLQITRTGFDGEFPPAHHRQSESLQTGSVTMLNVTPLPFKI